MAALAVGSVLVGGACGRENARKEARNLLLPDPVPGVTPPPADVLEWVRRDSELVMGVNLAQLRQTPLWREQLAPWLTAQLAATLPAMRSRCGLDLVASVDHLAVGLRRFATTAEGNVVLTGPEPKVLWACVQACREALRADGIDPMWDGDILSLRTASGDGVTLVAEDDGVIRGLLGVEVSSEDLKKSAKKPPMLKGSPGFRELYGALDGNASGWFLLQGPLLQPAMEEHVTLRAVTGAMTLATPRLGGVDREVDDGASTNLAAVTLDVRLMTGTPERAVRYAATANSRLVPAARAAFTRLAISADRDQVHLIASLTVPQLLALISRGPRLAELLVSP